MATKTDRIRIDVWASIRPIVEAEMNRSGLTANEVVNIALADYFGLAPSGKKQLTDIKPVESITTDTTSEDDYI